MADIISQYKSLADDYPIISGNKQTIDPSLIASQVTVHLGRYSNSILNHFGLSELSETSASNLILYAGERKVTRVSKEIKTDCVLAFQYGGAEDKCWMALNNNNGELIFVDATEKDFRKMFPEL